MSEAANWTDNVAPVNGDVIHFGGNVRMTPNNDFDAASFTFAGVQFLNDGSSSSNAAFTVTGNELVLNGDIKGVKAVAARKGFPASKSAERAGWTT